MLFTSLTFLVFFCAVFALYWANLAGLRVWRNLFLLAASYLFYGWWDWRFLGLIFVSSGIDYLVGRGLGAWKQPRIRKLLLFTSVSVNLGLLGIFKYFDFFAESLAGALHRLGVEADPLLLHLVLPVGISFYTFQTLSYSIDVYRRQMEPTHDAVAFFAFVAFFPQLVAGPIERAKRLLPQFQREKITFDYPSAVDGLRMILWGIFLKALIADNLAHYVNAIFANPKAQSGSVLALGAIYFGFQIYGDFAGYSLIARGVARLLGFDLMTNFRVPYFSRDIGEFWRRWHISLSTWFRDYLYIPLGGNRHGRWRTLANVMIVFLVSGLWHGAEWTFVIWGLLYGIVFAPLLFLRNNGQRDETIAPGRFFPIARELPGMIFTFGVVTIGWVFFRAENLDHAILYFTSMWNSSFFTIPTSQRGGVLWVMLLIALDWLHRNDDVPIRFAYLSRPWRWAVYLGLSALIYYRGYFGDQQFIYFQF